MFNKVASTGQPLFCVYRWSFKRPAFSIYFNCDCRLVVGEIAGNVTNTNFSFAADPFFGTWQKSNPGAQSWEILHRACGRSLNQGMKAPKAR